MGPTRHTTTFVWHPWYEGKKIKWNSPKILHVLHTSLHQIKCLLTTLRGLSSSRTVLFITFFFRSGIVNASPVLKKELVNIWVLSKKRRKLACLVTFARVWKCKNQYSRDSLLYRGLEFNFHLAFRCKISDFQAKRTPGVEEVWSLCSSLINQNDIKLLLDFIGRGFLDFWVHKSIKLLKEIKTRY